MYFMPQDPYKATASDLTVSENLALSGKATDLHMEMMRSIGLAKAMNRHVYNLSGGQRQLLSLIIAAVRKSPILLLDEPTAALDQRMTLEAKSIIQTILAEGKSILLVSHNPKLWEDTATRKINM
jgi:ABC-type multidrug transport system ATPase subunit